MEEIKEKTQKTCCLMKMDTRKQKGVFFGTLIVKFGLAGFFAILQLQIYTQSYFYHQDKEINLALLNSMTQLVILPLSILFMFAVKCAEICSYKKLIRVCTIIFSAGLLLASFATSMYGYFFIMFACVACPYALILFPLVNCLNSYFPNDVGKVIGFIMAVSGLSSNVFQVIGFSLVNPGNQEATIPYYDKNGSDSEPTMLLFDYDVAQNAMIIFRYFAILNMFISIPGAFMVSHQQEEINKEKKKKNSLYQTQPSQQQIKTQGSNDQENPVEQVRPVTTKRKSDSIEIEKIEDINLELQDISPENDKDNIQLQQPKDQDAPKISTCQALFKQPFLIVTFITFTVSLYATFLSSNFKIYLLMQINDDEFLTYINSVSGLFSNVSTLIWGILFDRFSVRLLYTIQTVIFFAVSVSFPIIANCKIGLFFSYLLIGTIQSGVYALSIPALFKFYGQYLGEKVIPFKTFGFGMAYAFIPALTYYVIHTGNYNQTFMVLGVSQLFSIFAAAFIKEKYKF